MIQGTLELVAAADLVARSWIEMPKVAADCPDNVLVLVVIVDWAVKVSYADQGHGLVDDGFQALFPFSQVP